MLLTAISALRSAADGRVLCLSGATAGERFGREGHDAGWDRDERPTTWLGAGAGDEFGGGGGEGDRGRPLWCGWWGLSGGVGDADE